MSVNTAAGSKLYIGPVVAATVDTQGEFEALSYTEVGEIESIGDFGDQFNDVTALTLNDSRMRHFKGSVDGGQLQLTILFDDGDAGQQALKSALAVKSDYAIKLTLANESAGSPANPTTIYFRGQIQSRRLQVGNADNIVRAVVNIGVNSAQVEVAAV